MSGTRIADILVIGAGMAGASVAAELSGTARVALLEAEERPGLHSTGRSAALFTTTYGPAPVRALSRASRRFLEEGRGPAGAPFLRPRGVMFLARADQAARAAALIAEMGAALKPVTALAARDRVPLLRAEYLAEALADDVASDIDVDALHQHYLRGLRAAGSEVTCAAPVRGLARAGDCWKATTPAGDFAAPVIVNAAGAWADEVAALAGLAPIGLQPKRRTALLVAPPEGVAVDDWPMLVDVDEQFYVKPDAGMLLLSPADATPCPPCDAQPEELDIAIAVDRVQQALDLPVRRIAHRWAGLRSFVADGVPVAGFDPAAEGFFWLAGQGGYGIQTAPALARLAAALVRGEDVPQDIAAEGVSAADLAPGRPGLGGRA